MNPHLLPKLRSEALLHEVRFMPCTLRLASFGGMQCAPQDTVVPCHLPVHGKGMGTKVTDLAVAAGCQVCHDLLDGRDRRGIELAKRYPAAWYDRLLRGLIETQTMWLMADLIYIKDGELI